MFKLHSEYKPTGDKPQAKEVILCQMKGMKLFYLKIKE